MKKKLEPLPGTERTSENQTVVSDATSRTGATPIDDRSATTRARERRQALRKRKLAEDAVLVSAELRGSIQSASDALQQISDRVVEIEQNIVGSNEAAAAILEATDGARKIAESFRTTADGMGQVLSALSMITHGVLSDVQGFKQLTDRLKGVSTRAARYMQHLSDAGGNISSGAAKSHEHADEINVLAFNMRLESSRIGDEAAAISVVAKHFHRITRQAEEAVVLVQKHQGGFDAAIDSSAAAVTDLKADAETQNTASSELAVSIGDFIEQMRRLREKSGSVELLADAIHEKLGAFAGKAKTIRRGSEEMAGSISEISAGIHEQSAAMVEIANRANNLEALGAEFKDKESADAIDAINTHMIESDKGIQQIRTTIHQAVDAIHQIAASAAEQQALSAASMEQLQAIGETNEDVRSAILDAQQGVDELTTQLEKAQGTIGSVLEAIDGLEGQGGEILERMDELRRELDGISQALGRLLDYSMMIATTGFSGEIEAARLGDAGEMFLQISSEVSELGDRSSDIARDALWSASNARDRIDLIKRSVFDVGEILRTTSEQRSSAKENLAKVASETMTLLENTNQSAAFIKRVHESFEQMTNRMGKLTAAADRVVSQSSETMEFLRQQVETFDDLGETIAAFTELTDET